jgi:hypothetical protein
LSSGSCELAVGAVAPGGVGEGAREKNGKGSATFPAEALGTGAVAELPSPLVVEGVLTAIVARTISAMDSRVRVGGGEDASRDGRGVSSLSGTEADGEAQSHGGSRPSR